MGNGINILSVAVSKIQVLIHRTTDYGISSRKYNATLPCSTYINQGLTSQVNHREAR